MKYDFFGRLITNAKYFAVLLSKCDYKETTKSILLHKQADSFFITFWDTCLWIINQEFKSDIGPQFNPRKAISCFDHDSIWSTEAHLWLSAMSCWSTLVDTFKVSEHRKNIQLGKIYDHIIS